MTDSWIRRTILGDPAPYHRLGLPPDHRIGQPEANVDVTTWGIDIWAEAPLDEVLDVRTQRIRDVHQIARGLTTADLTRACAHNPAPGFPPMTAVPIGVCLDLVVNEEWAHHGYATRDLAVLEQRC